MSRIGRKPIPIPKGVTTQLDGTRITVKGPKGEISRLIHAELAVAVEGETIVVRRPSDETRHKALHGLTRTDRKSTRLNSSHVAISYAVFCWQKKRRFQINSRQFVDPEFPDLKCLHLLFPRCFQIELDRDKITAQIVGLAGVKETNILPVHRD